MKMEAQIQMIPIDQIIPNSFQPRIEFDQEAIERLSNSIRVHGIILPLTVKRVNDKFELISGERRIKAAQMVGLTAVPCIVCAVDDNESAEISIIEKLHSQDLSAIEEAKCYKKLLDRGYINQEQLLQRMGIDAAKFEGKLRLLNLAQPVQDALLKNKISEKHARSLLKVLDQNKQVELLNDVINSRLTVKQLDDRIDIALGNKTLEDFGDELNINETKPEFRPDEYQYNSAIKDTGSNNPFFNNLENAPVSMDDPTLSMGENPFLAEQRLRESGIIEIDDSIDGDLDIPGEESKKDEINLEIFTPKDLINAIKNEEFDFTDINQMIIKISKEKKEETEESA